MSGTISIKKLILFLPTMILLGIVLSGCSAGKEMSSVWQENSVKIDGDYSDWKSDLIQIPDKKITLGFNNDNKFLYLCLITDDRFKIMQMVRAGFIVWFEPESGSNAKFGIKFPLSLIPTGMQQFPEMNRGEMQSGSLDNIINKMLAQQTELQIVNKDKYPLTALPLKNKEGIDLKLGYQSGKLIYELKVPLAAEEKYSFEIGALPGDKVKIKFETEELSRDDRNTGQMSRGSGRPPGGDTGMPPGTTRQRPGGGRGAGMGRPQATEPLEYEVTLTLVTPPENK